MCTNPEGEKRSSSRGKTGGLSLEKDSGTSAASADWHRAKIHEWLIITTVANQRETIGMQLAEWRTGLMHHLF